MVVSSLWACRFVFHPGQFPTDRPFVLLRDARVDTGAARLLAACAGDAVFAGEVAEPSVTPDRHRLVISSRDWPDLARSAMADLDAARIIILLHLDHDPHGYWDFALGGTGGPGLGGSLSRTIASRSLDAYNFADVARHADYWMASRTRGGRISAGAHHIMAQYPATVADNATRLVNILGRLADQKSRDVLTRILFGTAEQVLEGYVREVFGPQQYMEIINIRPGDVVINGGVETGWELPYFIALMRGEGHIHSFDPIFQIAGRWAETSARAFAHILTDHELALVDTDRSVRLAVEPEFGTAYASTDADTLSSAGLSFRDYSGRTLDSLVAEGRVGRFTVVKLDVEGGELEALRGMEASLRRFRPRLAVAIYHQPEHFFEVPDYLMGLLPDYRWYMRQYSCGRFETLLYAVPNEDGESCSGEEFGPLVATLNTPRTAPIFITAYLQDMAARHTHRGGDLRQLDRVHGAAWAMSTLTASARIDGLEISSVTETQGNGCGTVVARVSGSNGRDAIFVGAVGVPPGATWTASREVAAGSSIPVVGFEPSVAVVAEYICADDSLYIYRLGDGQTEGVSTLRAMGMRPLALHPGEKGGIMNVLAQDNDRVVLLDMAISGGAERRMLCQMPGADLCFRAVCIITDHEARSGQPGYGYIFTITGKDEQMVFAQATDGTFRLVTTLDWPVTGFVSTGMVGCRAERA